MKRWFLIALFGLAPACAPSGQLILYIDTDAPVPPEPGTLPDPMRPPALFDRLRIEVLHDGQPIGGADAVNDFAVDERGFREGLVSVGIAPPIDDPTVSVRVTLFRGDRLQNGVPPQLSSLRRTVRLPPIDAAERRGLTVILHVDDVGQPLGEPDPLDADLDGPPGSSLVGSWPGATVVPCASAAPPGQACVPGGAFWFGDPALRLSFVGLNPPSDERLVVISPFFIDTQEVTVGAFRVKWAKLGGRYMPLLRDLSQDPTSPKTGCTWTDPASGDEELPINCLPHDTAQLYCRAVGGQLPTEAQLEFVSSGRGRELGYPWGNDEPSCADAVWGLGRGGGAMSAVSNADDSCRASTSLGGVHHAGSARLDRLSLVDPVSQSTVEVLDLAGNLSEWTRDRWSRLDEPFWHATGVLHDPLADRPSDADPSLLWVERAGSWTDVPYELRAAFRQGAPEAASYAVGFRCAH